MNENHAELLSEFHQLIDTFCEISSTHHEYAGNLSQDLNKAIEKAILDEFDTLYALHIEKLTASTGIELYALQTKNGMTIPQRRRRWYTFWKKTPNPAAKAVEEKIYENADFFFEDLLNRTDAITELKQLLEQAQAAQNIPSAASKETPETITLPPQPGSPAAQPIVKWPSESAQENPTETWEEEHAFPSETLANPSE